MHSPAAKSHSEQQPGAQNHMLHCFHFEFLLHQPEAANIGRLVNAAMRDIEVANAQLAGVLPRIYHLFTGSLG